ncbi:MAG: FdtA/QdtA family cupin domain-containing protein [Muribaculaceae bacterium]|nr:FdtA/QdtA family cupin domain-containing protein [Muribaculaceae bacterium]
MNKLTKVNDCKMISLEKYPSERLGNLSVVESMNSLPFDIKRMFFIYDVPGGESRGGHSHREIREFIVAASGSFLITLDDGVETRTVMMNQPYNGLLVEPGIWITLHDFSSGAIALVFTSDLFNPDDHIKDYRVFLESRNK